MSTAPIAWESVPAHPPARAGVLPQPHKDSEPAETPASKRATGDQRHGGDNNRAGPRNRPPCSSGMPRESSWTAILSETFVPRPDHGAIADLLGIHIARIRRKADRHAERGEQEKGPEHHEHTGPDSAPGYPHALIR